MLQYNVMTELVQRYHIAGSTAADIATSIETRIRTGELQPGARLPTVRALAAELGVSPVTVAAAYRRLTERGLLSAAGRRGTTVCPGPLLPSRLDVPRLPAGVRNLADGNPDPALLPDLTAAARRLHLAHRLYGDDPNLPDLLDLAAAELRRDGLDASAIAVVGGAMDGIERTLLAHLRAGDRVAVEDPCYPAVRDLVAAMGMAADPVSVDDFGPRPDDLERALTGGVAALVLTPRAHNPTGAALDETRAAELRKLLDAHPGVLLVEDDHAGVIAGAEALSLSPGHQGPWAVVRSAAKSLGPDLRLAILAGDPLTVARVEGRQRLGPGWVSHVLQELVVTLLRDPATADLVRRAEMTYSQRRTGLVAALARRGLPGRGRSGLNVWIPVAEEAATVQHLLSRGWGVRGGERYRFRAAPAIRVTTADLQPDEADRFATDLAELLRGARRTGPA